ncbi:acyltransferase family protein [Allosphingosinicella humi]
MSTTGAMERRYGLDWLRIGAFGLLILYHIGMFFVPWDWHTKTAQPLEWLELPMLSLTPWRLSLLFLISGVASRVLLAKSDAGSFTRSRSRRLLIPLLAGMVLFVAPQPWVELSEKAGYAEGFAYFWLHDYFEFGASTGLILPTYNHLWFVAYLWLYTMALALFSLAPAAWRRAAQGAFDRLFGGWRVVVLPILFLWLLRATLFPIFGETHIIFDDPYNHLVYGFAFFFGVGLARSERIWTLLTERWGRIAVPGVAGYAVILLLDLTIPGESGNLELLVARLARSLQAWGIILALLGLAQRHLHRDGPARRYLTDAIFPYYIAHQTIIVLVGHALKPHGLGAGAEFAIILAATVTGCAATYELVRRVGWLRPLFGLRTLEKRSGADQALAPA